MVLAETARVRAIRKTEQTIVASLDNVNGLLTLLAELRDDNDTAVAIAAMHSLRRAFIHLLDSRGAAAGAALCASDDSVAGRKRPRASSPTGQLSTAAATPDAAYRAWLQARFSDFIDRLLSWLRDSEDANFRLPALRTLMGFVELEPSLVPIKRSAGRTGGRFSNGIFSKVIAALVLHRHACGSPSQCKLLTVFGEEYINSFDDVRYYMLTRVRALARRAALDNKILRDTGNLPDGSLLQVPGQEAALSITEFAERAVRLLMCVIMVEEQADLTAFLVPVESVQDVDPDTESDDEDMTAYDDHVNIKSSSGSKRAADAAKLQQQMRQVQRIRYHRKVFADAWLACLALPLPAALYKDVLLFLPEAVIPAMGNPLKLADFFTESYNTQGGSNSVLALDSLFLLMTQHNLDYPAFYDSLLAQLTPSLLHARHRARLFRMLDLCLSSSHLSSAAAAVFAKKACRLALLAPPSAALFALALARKVLATHPQCRALVCREELRTMNNPLTSHTKGQPVEAAAMAATAATEATQKADVAAQQPATVLPDTIAAAGKLLSTSSLWEIAALRRHYHPAVSTLAKGFAQKSSDAMAATAAKVEPFTALTYKALFDQEMKRKSKGPSNGDSMSRGSKSSAAVTTAVTFVPPLGLLQGIGAADEINVFAGNFEL